MVVTARINLLFVVHIGFLRVSDIWPKIPDRSRISHVINVNPHNASGKASFIQMLNYSFQHECLIFFNVVSELMSSTSSTENQ